MTRITQLLRKPFVWGALTGVVLSATGVAIWTPSVKVAAPKVASQIQLAPAHLVYKATDRPHLALTLPKRKAKLSDLLAPPAMAAAEPIVEVNYHGGPSRVPVKLSQTTSGYDISLEPNAAVRPGKYEVKVTGQTADGQAFTQESNFAWGVLAINPTKSVYTPGETVTFDMAVLDSWGHTLCSAPLELVVTSPSGDTQSLPYANSADCHGDNYVNQPDYTASYITAVAGTYKLRLGIKNTDYQITDAFIVAVNPAFAIERGSISRFNPNYDYGMHLHITASRAFAGSVTETLPDPRYVVNDPGGAVVTTPNNTVVLTWRVNWQAGHSYDLAYTFHPPRQAPSFFVLAPADFTANDGSHIYSEFRGWQMAGDAAITFVKQTSGDSGAAASNTLDTTLTSTSGNTLIMVWGCNCSTGTRFLNSVTDSSGNTWTLPSLPSTNPPSLVGSTATSTEFFVAFVRNATAIATKVTTVVSGGAPIKNQGLNVMEFSGMDNLAPTFGNNLIQGTAAATQTSAALSVTTCDSPTTDELMGQGSWFCSHSPAYVLVGAIFCGNNTYTMHTGDAFTQRNTVNINGGNNNVGVSYLITSASGSYSTTMDLGTSKDCATGMFAMGQDVSGTSTKQALFWAK